MEQSASRALATQSRAGSLASKLRRSLTQWTDEELSALLYDWHFWARPQQLPPPDPWTTWLLRTGRGFGKTRTGAEWVRAGIESKRFSRVALVARTSADVRDVMIEGESGILSISPPWCRPIYEVSKRRLTWPNGAIATTYTADEPDLLRGPQHDAAWCDELASWRYHEAWSNLLLGLRGGQNPQVVVTTTPRPSKLIHEISNDPTTIVTTGSTLENAANLAPTFLSQVLARYRGTRLERQEVFGELLTDIPGALWHLEHIERARVERAPELVRVVVAIDPAVTAEEGSDETGMIVAGKDRTGDYYVLDDLSARLSPDEWATRAVGAYRRHQADRIVAEVNNGGDLVERVIRSKEADVAYSGVHATRGKARRAEPIAALYEQGRVRHVGVFAALEDQMMAMTPDAFLGAGSPDRMDALVWAITELSEGSSFIPRVIG